MIEFVPTASNDVVRTAVPVASSGTTGAFSGIPLSRNITGPAGVGPPGDTGATTAVNVTGWPAYTGLADDASVVVVGIVTTLSKSVDEDDVALYGSPE